MRRSDVIDNGHIKPGNVIVGLASFGQATYEKQYNGGMGSNGLTSARHDVFSQYYAEHFPESYDHSLPKEVVYCGQKRLTDSTAVPTGVRCTPSSIWATVWKSIPTKPQRRVLSTSAAVSTLTPES